MNNKDINILIVDDEEYIIALLKQILDAEGYSVDCAPDGEDAADLMNEKDYDIVITDVHMPKSGGLEVLFNTHDKERPPEVIIVSGGGRDLSFHFDEAEMLGAAQTIKKPFKREEILEAITTALENRI